MPNFSSLAGLEVARLIRSGYLGKDNHVGDQGYPPVRFEYKTVSDGLMVFEILAE